MMEGLLVPLSSDRLSWMEADGFASVYGPKGARLLTLPGAWTPKFILLSHDLTTRIITGNLTPSETLELSQAAKSVMGDDGLIVRSSVLGETIWERGRFHSEALDQAAADIWEFVIKAAKNVQLSAGSRKSALVLQEFIKPEEQGEFGNLARISKTRDQWEYSIRAEDLVSQTVRFNSQRDTAPSNIAPLLARARLSRERLFGAVAAWVNNELVRGTSDRVNCEWVRKADRYYVVQVDREDEDVTGINPMQVHVSPSIITSGSGEYLRSATAESRRKWDKLSVLDELFSSDDPIVPTLFVLTLEDATQNNREALVRDFTATLKDEIVVRVSVTSDAKRITNLPKTDCLSAESAADWCIEEATKLTRLHPDKKLAFIAHHYIDARAAAWVRADPDTHTVEVHGNWGLPDALQFCPYDTWEVHFPAGEITEYPAYKSNVLLKTDGGEWKYERVKNEVARFQSLNRSQVLDVAQRTLSIAQRYKKPCHVMWFVGCQTDDGQDTNIPWYRTHAHEIALPDKRTTHTFAVKNAEDLERVAGLHQKFPGLGVRLEPDSQELLRDNAFLKRVADTVVPLRVPIILGGSTLAHAFFQLADHDCVVISAGEKDFLRPRKQVNYAKLVRDKIPEKIASQNEKQTVTTAPQEYRLGYLIGKMVEEGLEVREASEVGDRLLELADVYEVLRALATLYDIDIDNVITAAKSKREKSGGFDAGQLLWETSLPNSREPGGTSDSAADAELMLEQTSSDTLRIPFTFLGFSGIGVPRSIALPSAGLAIQFTLQRDCIEVAILKQPAQLILDL